MSTLDGVGGAPTPTTAPSRVPGRVSGVGAASVGGVRGRGGPGGQVHDDGSLVGFDPLAALTEAAMGASLPPAAGLSAQLLEWAAPNPRQFDTVAPARLMPLLSLAVDRLADEADQSDELGELGAVALTRELQDHRALAERRATLIGS